MVITVIEHQLIQFVKTRYVVHLKKHVTHTLATYGPTLHGEIDENITGIECCTGFGRQDLERRACCGNETAFVCDGTIATMVAENPNEIIDGLGF